MSSSRQFHVLPSMIGRMRRAAGAMIADNAVIVGDVRLAADVNVWFGVTIRADDAPIVIGAETNVQDHSVVHVDTDAPLTIGKGVTIGHAAVVHGVEIGDWTLVGMGARLLSGCRIGEYCIVGAGALVPEGVVIPPRSVVLGLPGRVHRQVTAEEVEAMRGRADHYVQRARTYLPR